MCRLYVYQVSGEYAMLKAASMNGWLDEKAVVMEALTGKKTGGSGRHIDLFRTTGSGVDQGQELIKLAVIRATG